MHILIIKNEYGRIEMFPSEKWAYIVLETLFAEECAVIKFLPRGTDESTNPPDDGDHEHTGYIELIPPAGMDIHALANTIHRMYGGCLSMTNDTYLITDGDNDF